MGQSAQSAICNSPAFARHDLDQAAILRGHGIRLIGRSRNGFRMGKNGGKTLKNHGFPSSLFFCKVLKNGKAEKLVARHHIKGSFAAVAFWVSFQMCVTRYGRSLVAQETAKRNAFVKRKLAMLCMSDQCHSPFFPVLSR